MIPLSFSSFVLWNKQDPIKNFLLCNRCRCSANMNRVTEKKSEAWSLRGLAEKRFKDFNLKYALKYTKRAHHLDPNLNGPTEMLTSFQILWFVHRQLSRQLILDSSSGVIRSHQHTKKTIQEAQSTVASNPYFDSKELFKHVEKVYLFYLIRLGGRKECNFDIYKNKLSFFIYPILLIFFTILY